MAEFDEAMRSSGGGGGGYGRAIQQAKEQLRDIQANRNAIKKTYEEYGAFIDPISQEAIDAAVAMVAEAQPQLANIAQAAAEELQASFDAPDQVLSEEAQLIAAGAQNIEAMTARRDGLNELYMAQEQDAANQASTILGLTSEAARLSAVAEQKLDQGEMRRRAEQTDIGFKQLEDQAREQLEQARAAARAAAAAAAARRRALAKEQEAAIAELDARYNNPAMRGRINAAEFLRREAGDLDYNRQQLMWNTLTEVIERQVPVGEIRRFVNGNGQVMSNKELFLLEGAARSFIAGMRAQQNRDRSSSPFDLRNPAYVITPPPRG